MLLNHMITRCAINSLQEQNKVKNRKVIEQAIPKALVPISNSLPINPEISSTRHGIEDIDIITEAGNVGDLRVATLSPQQGGVKDFDKLPRK